MIIENLKRIKEKLSSGKLSSVDINIFRKNVIDRLPADDPHFREVREAFDNARASDAYIIFMGFCPGADFQRRQDIRWRDLGICEFEYDDSESQVRDFNEIRVGDLVVLKKIEQFGKSMRLFGHGRVRSVKYNDEGRRYLEMDWSSCDRTIEVPLLACNSTVNRKTIALVEKNMPADFHDWLKEGVR